MADYREFVATWRSTTPSSRTLSVKVRAIIFEDLTAGLIAEAIVKVFEEIDIDQQKVRRLAVGLGCGGKLVQRPVETFKVRDLG